MRDLLRIRPPSPHLQIAVVGECIAIEVVEGKFARSPRSIVDAVGISLNAPLTVFAEERVWVLH
jgi:hypothetical protein